MKQRENIPEALFKVLRPFLEWFVTPALQGAFTLCMLLPSEKQSRWLFDLTFKPLLLYAYDDPGHATEAALGDILELRYRRRAEKAKRTQSLSSFLFGQYFRKYWDDSEDEFNELTHLEEWLLAKGRPLWRVQIIYHWCLLCTWLNLFKSITLGTAKMVFLRRSGQ